MKTKHPIVELACQQAMDFGVGIYYHSGKIYRETAPFNVAISAG